MYIKKETNDRVSPEYFKFKENMDNIISYILNPTLIPPSKRVNKTNWFNFYIYDKKDIRKLLISLSNLF